MTTVLTYGTFDLFHIGHLNLLARARALGDRLVVAVSSDKFNRLKNKTTLIPYAQRKAIVEAIRFVDKVIPEHNWEQKVRDIQRHKVDIFVMGDDWKGKFDHLKQYCKVVYVQRTKGVSTTQLKTAMQVFGQLQRDLA